jgi:hypothetical protein
VREAPEKAIGPDGRADSGKSLNSEMLKAERKRGEGTRVEAGEHR